MESGAGRITCGVWCYAIGYMIMAYRTSCWFLILFACFYGLGSYPLLDHNEGMYAAIAKDMLKSGDFIIPHLNGVSYIEKPPLLYWLTAAALFLFGENEWAARLVPALALLLTAWKLDRFLTRAIGAPIAGPTAALIFVTSLPLLAMARMVMCDMLMTCFLSVALIFFYEWFEKLHPRGQGNRYLMGFYFCLALAVMAKGFVAVILAGGAIATFLVWQRCPGRGWLEPLSPIGILLFLCVIAPWHIAATLKEPGFAYFYFINEHVLRFLNMRQPHDYYTGHAWYYLVRIPGYLIPWTLFLLLLVKKNVALTSGSLRPFLWSWFLCFLVFFSASGGKANYYMIAGMPPLVMLLALQLERVLATDPRFVRGLAAIALILIISALELVKFSCHEGRGDLFPICQIVSWPVIGCAACYIFAVILLFKRLPPRWIVPLFGAQMLLLLPLLISGTAMAGERISQKPVAEFLKTSGGHAAVYQEFEELSALAFYLDKPLVVVDSRSSDLLYGQQHFDGAHSQFITMAEWMKQTPPLPMVILNKRLASVMTANHNLCVMQKFDRVSVIKRCK